jgi:hypothetical protein
LSLNLLQSRTSKILDDLHAACEKVRAPLRDYWKANYRRLAGQHERDVTVITSTGTGHKVGSQTGSIIARAAILNVSDRRHKKWLSQMVEAARNFSAIAASNNDKDVEAAKGASAMLRARMSEHGGQDLAAWFENAANVRCCDLSFMLVEGDSTLGRPLRLMDGGEIAQGEVLVETLDAGQVDWYPGVKNQRKSPAIGITQFFTRNEMVRRWGPFPKKPIEAKWPENSHMVEMEPGVEESMYQVRRLFILPCADFPNGAQRIQVGGNPETDIRKVWVPDEKLIENGQTVPVKKRGRKHEWIGTPDGKHPIVPFISVPINKASAGRGAMHITANIQIPLNYAWTHLFNLLRATASVYVTTPPPGDFSKEKLVAGPGISNLPYQMVGGQKIEFVGPAAEAMRTYLEIVQFCVSMLDDVFGQPQESRGQLKTGRTSGKALQMADAFASATAGPETMLFQVSSAEVQMRILLEGQRVWPEKFVYEAVGDNKKLEANYFKKADLTSVVDVRMAPDSPWPKDKASRWKWGLEKLGKGGYGNPEDPRTLKKFNDDMNMPTDDDVLRDEQVQKQGIRKEMIALKKKDMPAHFSDDDAQHIRDHLRLLAEEQAQGKITDKDYPQKVINHTVVHQFNMQRKSQLEQAELAAGVPNEAVYLADMEAEQAKVQDLVVQAQQATEAAQIATQEAQGGQAMLAQMREQADSEREPLAAGVPGGM